jgi:sugar phosphate isomerase/epimerase
MKLSFATLGCPEWTIDDICLYGSRYGYDGVGLRTILGEPDLTKVDAFSERNRKATLRKFARANLKLVIVGTSVKLCFPAGPEREENLRLGKAHIDLACELGVDKIRVFGGKTPEGIERTAAAGHVVEGLKRLGDYGAEKGVMTVIETHDDYIDTSLLKDVVEKADNEWVKVLWDVHHPFRMMGESMRESWQNVGAHVVHTHFKDSRPVAGEPGAYQFTLMGEGDVPNREAIALLHENGYDGFLSLEWELLWHPDLAGPHEAFPQYVTKMKEYLAEL